MEAEIRAQLTRLCTLEHGGLHGEKGYLVLILREVLYELVDLIIPEMPLISI